MLHMASRSLQHWLNVGVSQNWLSFSHFPREAKQMKCGEKIVDGQFLPFHPRSVYLAFGHHSNNSCLACWVVQFDGTAWLNAGLCHKYKFYYMDLTMPPKNHAVFLNIVQIYLKVPRTAPWSQWQQHWSDLMLYLGDLAKTFCEAFWWWKQWYLLCNRAIKYVTFNTRGNF